MLILFKSAASGNVITLERNAREILTALHKDPDAAQGIVTVEQLPEAITRLRGAIDADASLQTGKSADHFMDEERQLVVSFCQRGQPVLELLERSLAEKVPVIWEG